MRANVKYGRPAKRYFLAALAVALLGLLPLPALAQENPEDAGQLAAVQKRRYRLDHEIYAAANFLPWDAFYKGVGPTGSYTWHFSDQLGWEVLRGSYIFRLPTGLRDQLTKDFNVSATRFEEMEWMVSSGLMYRPLYGKFSISNRKVVHAEMYGTLGGTVAHYTQTFKPGAQLGAGGRFFLTTWMSLRLDARYHLLISDKFTHVVELTGGLAFNLGGAD